MRKSRLTVNHADCSFLYIIGKFINRTFSIICQVVSTPTITKSIVSSKIVLFWKVDWSHVTWRTKGIHLGSTNSKLIFKYRFLGCDVVSVFVLFYFFFLKGDQHSFQSSICFIIISEFFSPVQKYSKGIWSKYSHWFSFKKSKIKCYHK